MKMRGHNFALKRTQSGRELECGRGNDSENAMWLGAAANAGGRREFGLDAGSCGTNAADQ
jgi:hypothetical protein